MHIGYSDILKQVACLQIQSVAALKSLTNEQLKQLGFLLGEIAEIKSSEAASGSNSKLG